ncbi:ABC transporter substrate-binding protein [Teichococcus aestuarii]|uniref:ABC transporter substrate-binding protein n=1 Tax=Teichococcus aestuarii TaxID=568898 RepID=UPI00360A103F
MPICACSPPSPRDGAGGRPHRRFHLREGVRFHNGAPFGAEDVVFSFCRVLNNESEVVQSYSRLVRPIAALEVVDRTRCACAPARRSRCC